MLNNPESQITPGIPDSDFIRAQVPMTKEEVRIVSICKLHLEKDSVVYDIGSGTGSCAVEIAGLSEKIRVIAVEAKPDAAELIKQNIRKFDRKNILVVEGLAPEVIENLSESVTHAFIGGTKGRLKEILAVLLKKKKNSRIRVVINAVSLESIGNIPAVLKEFEIENFECLQLAVSRSEAAGQYHIMKAENPVYIFSFDLCGEKA